MKSVKMLVAAAALFVGTATLFAFKSNSKMKTVTALYFGASSTQIATPVTGFWSETSTGGFQLAKIKYGTTEEIITYDQANQVYFKP
ncbi:hypothetical protein [Niastella sp. OAS944]|uniref:hypothetical protein n=1 Tax=Niastella sp. OAS944 TaxID=2664089 RepID=UPI00347D471B|nr:hypothetical protein [Chitinophagaceae bacterium OAS944]